MAYEPSRGGVRGGRDQFDWEDVKTDKDRENYLAHSLMAPVGRWQKGRDLTWYTKESVTNKNKSKLQKEIAAVKRAEEEAMAVALGLKSSSSVVTAPLSKQEMADVFQRRTAEEAEADGRETIKGVGFRSHRSAMMFGRSSTSGPATAFEQESSQNDSGDRLVLKQNQSDISQRKRKHADTSESSKRKEPTEHYKKSKHKHKSSSKSKKHKKEKTRSRRHSSSDSERGSHSHREHKHRRRRHDSSSD